MKKLLDRHGYPFQRAVEEAVKEISRNRLGWTVHTTEFPVETRGRTTRIDLLLLQGPSWLVVECKRVDPAFTWFFARGGSSLSHRPIVEELQVEGGRVITGYGHHAGGGGRPYNIALVARSDAAGDGTGAGRNQIEDAATQVLGGASGLVNFFAAGATQLAPGEKMWIMPAIVTTAKLLTTEADISKASLADGLLQEEVETQERGWLWYQYQRSPHLGPELETSTEQMTPRQANEYKYARSIAVVNAGSLGSFLEDVV